MPSDRVEGTAEYGAEVRIVDVSSTGALVESPRNLSRGTMLTLDFEADGTPLSIRARAVHCTPHGEDVYRVGVRFDGLTQEEQERLRSLVRPSPSSERREQPRVFLGQPAQMRREVELRVLNLSMHGGLFAVRFPLEFDSTHEFVFHLPQGEVRARGVVRHCEAWAQARETAIFKLGVEFTELSPANRDRVLAFLEDQIQPS